MSLSKFETVDVLRRKKNMLIEKTISYKALEPQKGMLIMIDLSRRESLRLLGIVGPIASLSVVKQARGQDKSGRAEAKSKSDITNTEQETPSLDRLIAAGFTVEQVEVWQRTAMLASKLLSLPKLHGMDDHELNHAIHTIQYRILARSISGSDPSKSFKADPGPKLHSLTPEEAKVDRDRVISAGFTAEEADCWQLTAKVADILFTLPKLNEMDLHEMTHAIHAIQYRIPKLARQRLERIHD